ncbi:MAG: ferric reductase-like transmembrane domain-containing protein [Candidatus Paracaedibacteraceae bacterium]|nr:ferric reductase-like transmembrane domain-containing protein [Candidatus Paracaedibacteraceae bacterium]
MKFKFLKSYNAWIITHAGVIILAGCLILRPDLKNQLILYTGYGALFHLVLVLALNPLKSIFATSVLLKKINRYRREIGVACFSYSVIHVACFIVKRGGLSETLKFIFHPALISVFFVAFPLLFLLTITSNNASIKKMGFLKWKKLHKKVYIAEIAVLIHLFMLGAIKLTFLTFLPLITLQLIRKHLAAKHKAISLA